MATENIKILGIDTSCDDTAVALLGASGSRFEILSNVVSSQVKIHQKYGGVYPFLAKREHQKNLSTVFKRALRDPASLTRPDLIGVTVGPGLEPCLWQGINFAKDLAEKYKIPLIPVNHLEAHILANWLVYKNIPLPVIGLVVSGGHTQLILMKDIGKYKLIGETRDDAAGECFDKAARILGLGYPGGPAIDAEAEKLKAYRGRVSVRLPRPMIKQKNYDFSFSGLKTAVLYNYRNQPAKIRKSKKYIRAMCFEVQQAIIDVLIYKTMKAARNHRVKSVILGGGVVASQELREQFKKACLKWDIKHFVPPKNLCTDNAAMVAVTAYFHRKERENLENITADANLRI